MSAHIFAHVYIWLCSYWVVRVLFIYSWYKPISDIWSTGVEVFVFSPKSFSLNRGCWFSQLVPCVSTVVLTWHGRWKGMGAGPGKCHKFSLFLIKLNQFFMDKCFSICVCLWLMSRALEMVVLTILPSFLFF